VAKLLTTFKEEKETGTLVPVFREKVKKISLKNDPSICFYRKTCVLRLAGNFDSNKRRNIAPIWAIILITNPDILTFGYANKCFIGLTILQNFFGAQILPIQTK
jgi:hypothetical protein